MMRLALILVAIMVHAAGAAPKVAITPIDGDSKKGEIRAALTDALSGNDLVVVPKKEVNSAVADLEDVANFTESDAKKLAKAVEADAVVHGKLMDSDAGNTLKIQLFVKGKQQKGFSVKFKNAKAPAFRKKLHDAMVKKIKSAMPDEADPPEDEEEAAPAKKETKAAPKCKKGKKCKAEPAEDEETPARETKKKALKDGEDDENPLPTAKKGQKEKKGKADAKEEKKEDSGEETAKTEEKKEKAEKSEGDDEEASTRKAAKKETAKKEDDEGDEKASATASATVGATPTHTANRAAVRLDAGVSFDGRTMQFNSNLPADQAPKNFKSKPVPGARFDVDVFPLAFSSPKSFLAGVGVAVEYDKTIGEKIRNDVGQSAINQQHYVVAAQYRLVIGKSATAPSVTVGFGYGRRTFQIQNRTGLMDPDPPPDTDYKYYAPRAAFRLPVVSSIALFAGAEGMAIFNAGPIQRADQYGRAKVLGFTGQGGAEYVIGNRIAVRVLGEFNQVGFTFVGRGGDLANNRDMNPDTLDVGGAKDKSIGVVGTLAVIY
jgi:hypothetical protein